MFKIVDPASRVFIELSADGVARTIALPPERVAVVGSAAEADFRVGGVRVQPVEFQLERRNGQVYLIPVGGAHGLQLNGVRVSSPTALDRHSIVEFAGVRLAMTIIVAEGDATGVWQVPAPAPSEEEEGPTTTMPRAIIERMLTPPAPDETTQRLPVFRPSEQQGDSWRDRTMNGAEMAAPYRFGPPAVINPAAATDSTPRSMLGHAFSPTEDARPFDDNSIRAANPGESHHEGPTAASHSLPTRKRSPSIRTADARTQQRSWLSRLGVLTRARPLLVASLASLGALFLAVLPLAAGRLLQRQRPVVAAKVPVSATLNSLRPAPSASTTSPLP